MWGLGRGEGLKKARLSVGGRKSRANRDLAPGRSPACLRRAVEEEQATDEWGRAGRDSAAWGQRVSESERERRRAAGWKVEAGRDVGLGCCWLLESEWKVGRGGGGGKGAELGQKKKRLRSGPSSQTERRRDFAVFFLSLFQIHFQKSL